MTRVLAIDPGTTQSGWCMTDNGKVVGCGIEENEAILFRLPQRFGLECYSKDVLAIEMVASYGMAVGAETFRTVWWIGRFAEVWKRCHGELPMEVFRKDVKLHLCGTTKAKDPNVRQSLIDLYGGEGGKEAAIGKKASPGPLYGVTSHAWAALAVAVTAEARLNQVARAA